jgi:hypothetical protein
MLTLEGIKWNWREFRINSNLFKYLDNKKDYILLFAKEAASVNSIGKFEILRIVDVFAVSLNCDLKPDEILYSNTLLNNNNTSFVELRLVNR